MTATRPVGAEEGVLFRGDFSAPLQTDGEAPVWSLRTVPGFPQGDGRVRSVDGWLVVEPTGVDSVTGEPVFAGEHRSMTGTEHLRWAAFVRAAAGPDRPGFSAPATGALTVAARLVVTSTGRHPAGAAGATTEPDRDLKAGAAALICVDLETGLVFDFFLTPGVVFAVYERLPRPGSDHGTFSYAVPVAESPPGAAHNLAVTLDVDRSAVSWSVDGAEVMRIDTVGLRCVDAAHLKRSSAGPEQLVWPRQLMTGLALTTDEVHGQGIRRRARSLTVQGLASADFPPGAQ